MNRVQNDKNFLLYESILLGTFAANVPNGFRIFVRSIANGKNKITVKIFYSYRYFILSRYQIRPGSLPPTYPI